MWTLERVKNRFLSHAAFILKFNIPRHNSSPAATMPNCLLYFFFSKRLFIHFFSSFRHSQPRSILFLNKSFHFPCLFSHSTCYRQNYSLYQILSSFNRTNVATSNYPYKALVFKLLVSSSLLLQRFYLIAILTTGMYRCTHNNNNWFLKKYFAIQS